MMYGVGYGAAVRVPGLADILNFAHTGDNLGPPNCAAVCAIFRQVRQQFPDAPVRASTLDAFARQLRAVKAQLPVVTGELGDTWIHGVGTDPRKVAQFRALSRWRLTQPTSPARHRFSRASSRPPPAAWRSASWVTANRPTEALSTTPETLTARVSARFCVARAACRVWLR